MLRKTEIAFSYKMLSNILQKHKKAEYYISVYVCMC